VLVRETGLVWRRAPREESLAVVAPPARGRRHEMRAPADGGGRSVHYLGDRSVALAHSKLTAQGQISVPAKVRQRLGIGPGSVLEWKDDGGKVVVRKAGRYTSEEIHHTLFRRAPKRRTLKDMRRE